ncbi:MAG: 5'-methylthioadenosine/S-adenosylhomocysteine nucleosidase [Vicinamibacterales bacterium]
MPLRSRDAACVVLLACATITTLACAPASPAPAASSTAVASNTTAATSAPLVIQGAMPVETSALVEALANRAEVQVQGWTFWTGAIDGHPVVVSKTLKGMTNAAAATALAIERFHPSGIVNQGTAGGHDPALHVGDIVIGAASVNIGAFKTGTRARGQGTDFSEWHPMDLIRTEGSAGQDPNAWVMRRFPADAGLLAAARAVAPRYTPGVAVEGVIGSSDVWNSELDRIARLHDTYGTSVEEMETAAAAQVALASGVPFLGIRVLSNNITNDGVYSAASAAACQQFVLDVVREFLRGTR